MKAIIAAAAAITAALGVASAGTPAHAAARGHASPAVPLFRSSSVDAGYRLTVVKKTASVSATVVVPTATCTSTDEFMSLGVFVVRSRVATSGSAVQIDCSGGSPQYTGVCYSYNGGIAWSVNPGDTVQFSYQTPHGLCALSDTTNGQGGNLEFGPTRGTLVLVGVAPRVSGGVASPIPTFTNIPFSSASINGVTIAASGALRFNLVGNGVVEIVTSKLNSSGDGFTETFEDN